MMKNLRVRVRRAAGCLFIFAAAGCSQQVARDAGTTEAVMYPLPPAVPRIAYVTSISHASILGRAPNRMERFLFGRDPESDGAITKPFGLAAGRETLLVCDTQQSVVHVLDFKLNRFDRLGESGRGRLVKPVAVALDEQANRYVADAGRREIVVFSPENKVLRALGARREEPFRPVCVAVHAGAIYVLNGDLHRIEVLSPESGELLSKWGGPGEAPGQLLFPNGLAIDHDGSVYVTDMLNCRVQVFSPEGRLLRIFGQPGDRAGEFSRPKHVAIGPDGLIYVVDAAFQRVQMFDEGGKVLMLFGGPGNAPGSMNLPAGVCTDQTLLPHFADRIPTGFSADYLVFVSDQFGLRKINVFAFGRPG